MREADEHCTYLGLPNIVSRNKSRILGFLKEKVRTKINSWNGNLVARLGKEVLIKSVVHALPAYAINVFLLPIEVERDIERCLYKFWWQSKQGSDAHIRWMS